MIITMDYRKYLDQFYDGSRNYGICDAVQACHENARTLYYYQLTRYVVEAVVQDVQDVLGLSNPICFRDDTSEPDSSDNHFYPGLEATLIASGVVIPDGLFNPNSRIDRAGILQWLIDNGKTGRVLEIDLSENPGNTDFWGGNT
jgi:hypothetical protein